MQFPLKFYDIHIRGRNMSKIPIKWVKQAADSYGKWRLLSQQLKQETRKRKQEKIKSRMQIARRDLLASSGKLGGFGLFLGALGVGGTAAVKYFINKADPLHQAYEKNGKGFPFSSGYMDKLVNDSGITFEEMEGILLKNPGQEGLYTLTAYCLLRRAKKNGELSKRYDDYLNTMAGFIKSGTIKFKLTENLSMPHHKMEYENVEGKGIIKVSPGRVLGVHNLVIIESTIIHELFHGYQDNKKRTIRFSQLEAEAHLVQSDYILHVSPELIHEDHWIQIYPLEKSYNIKFLVPLNTVKSLINLEEDNPIYEKAILTIRQAYLLFEIMNQSVIPGRDRIIHKEVSSFSKEEIYQGAETEIGQMMNELKMKPLGEYLYNCRPSGPKGDYVNCAVKDLLSQFSTLVDYLANYAGASRDFHLMEQYYNRYFIKEWMDKRHSLLDSPFDRVIVDKGFK